MQSLITRHVRSPTSPVTKTQIIIYWIVTVIIALESTVGGIADIMQEPMYDVNTIRSMINITV